MLATVATASTTLALLLASKEGSPATCPASRMMIGSLGVTRKRQGRRRASRSSRGNPRGSLRCGSWKAHTGIKSQSSTGLPRSTANERKKSGDASGPAGWNRVPRADITGWSGSPIARRCRAAKAWRRTQSIRKFKSLRSRGYLMVCVSGGVTHWKEHSLGDHDHYRESRT